MVPLALNINVVFEQSLLKKTETVLLAKNIINLIQRQMTETINNQQRKNLSQRVRRKKLIN